MIIGYLNSLTIVDVGETSIAKVNASYGSGGTKQYYIEDFQKKLKPTGSFLCSV
jgi:hypothetical protein